MKRHIWRTIGLVSLGLLLLVIVSITMQTKLPTPTGSFAVGRTYRIWVDSSRPEELSDNPGDFRNVPVVIWYPVNANIQTKAAYFPNPDLLAKSLASSGEVMPLEAYGLRFIKSRVIPDALIANNTAAYPVIIFSPGNGTNMEFYSGITEELASHGYVVIGINHPYDVAAVILQDGSIAQFVSGPFAIEEREAWVAERVSVREADVLLILKMLESLKDDRLFTNHLDLSRISVIGHSLGGITAAEVCRINLKVVSCLNFDGIQRGGPFSTNANPTPPNQPFMMITKETQLPLQSIAKFKAIPSGSYLVTIKNGTHSAFSDGPLLIPSLLPLPNKADHLLSLIRKYTLAFLDQTLKQQPSPLLEKPLQSQEISLDIFSPP
jgi:dienelactone hydrolase